jgi:hypothetical protein
MTLGVERCNNSSNCLGGTSLGGTLVTTSSSIVHPRTWMDNAGGSPHRDMPQIIVKNHLDKNALRRVQTTAEARVVIPPHRKINFKASFKENRQTNNIVFRFVHEQGRTGLGVCLFILNQ